MTEPISYIDILKKQLETIGNSIAELLRSSRIEMREIKPNPYLAFSSKGLPPSKRVPNWSDLTDEQSVIQQELDARYSEFSSQVDSVFVGAPVSYQKELKRLDRDMRMWIRVRQAHGMPRSPDSAIFELNETLSHYESLLDKLHDSSKQVPICVPDTNILIDFPDPIEWPELLGLEAIDVVIPPSVVSELDQLKVSHRDPEIRKRVRRLISRIKDWRELGSLLSGIELSENVKIRMLANEPSFQDAPGWLDPENMDDRFIATSLQLQRGEPAAQVVILSHDLNLQNKAELANVPCAELEKPSH